MNNVFDIMAVFQEEIELRDDFEERILLARQAAMSISSVIKRLNSEQKAISLETGLAIVQSTEQKNTHVLIEDVGVIGDLRDANIIKIGDRLPETVAMEIDITHFFKPTDPDSPDLVLTSGNVPITQVKYIEHDLFQTSQD